MIEVNHQNKELKNYNFIDLFAGIGGFHYALKSFGANCVFASEIDSKASEIYEINHGLKPNGDITKIKENEIPRHDILCAGFPCQAFSISGKQKGFEDTRGTLFFDIARIVDFHKPKILFLENVKNFVRHDNANTLKTVLNTLKNLNYEVFYKVLNTSKFGLPQNRERVYIIGFNKNEFEFIDFSFPDPNLVSSLEEIMDDNPVDAMVIERDDIDIYKDFKPTKNIFGELEIPNKPIQIGKVNKGGQGERIYHPIGHAITLSAYGGGVGSKTGLYKVKNVIRKLSPRECARIQGFPENFKLPKNSTEAYKQFGNSVSINTLQHIIKEIVKTINKNDRKSRIRLTDSKKWIQERKRHSPEIQ
ncbi:DNA cytosine methyltransferase [Flavobacterium sp. CS20]|uniref:DNA cytosine methyltransferase n=1 Tax=Flavobacterium sp. CS20 TaxID=2775246 RepID=UPI001B39D869|nr:DNA cytosine methyltransferase [Flavobacterium sp. CS20]QTY27676.1 DNA cytosine methyltransferase [Flavobacterium sp. CS20]